MPAASLVRLLVVGVAACMLPACSAEEGDGIQHFENLVHVAHVVALNSDSSDDGSDSDGAGHADEQDGEPSLLRGAAYTAISSIIQGAKRSDHSDHLPHEVAAQAPDIVVDVPPCVDQEGVTAIRINGEFVTCAQLVTYCPKYQQVRDTCPVSCGLCGQDEDGDVQAGDGTSEGGGGDGDHSVAEDRQAVQGDSAEDAAPTTTTKASVDVPNSEQEEDDDDKLTAEEHVIALRLLLKKISMENEHLRLSLSECEAQKLDLQLRVLDKFSEVEASGESGP